MICSSVNRDFLIASASCWGGLYSKLERNQGLRSLGLLALILSGTLWLGINLQRHVALDAADQDDFLSLRLLLTEHLGSALPSWTDSAQGGALDFVGAPDQLVFIAPAPQALGPGFARYVLTNAEATPAHQLILTAVLDEPGAKPSLSAGFARGFSDMALRYFGPPPAGGAPIWQSQWTARTTLPEIVALDVHFPANDRRRWPTLLIHPRIEADVSCVISAATHRCLGR